MGTMSVEEYRRRQRAGMEKARAEGRLGKKPKPKPENYEEVVTLWREKKINSMEAAQMLGVCTKTFLKWRQNQ